MKTGDSYVRASVLAGFDSLVEDAGGNPATLLDEVGIPRSALADMDALISHRSVATLFELAAKRIDHPSFGLEWSKRIPDHFPNFGPIVLLSKFSRTNRDWLSAAFRHWAYHTNGSSLSHHPGPTPDVDCVRYAIDSFALAGRQIAEHAIANICRLVRVVCALPDLDPVAIRFRHGAPADISLHREIFRCPIEFDAEHNEILFENKLLDHPLHGRLAPFRRLMELYVRHRIDRMEFYDQSMSSTVGLVIPTLFATGRCNIETAASALDINVKKLQRLLLAEGTTFSEILEQVRKNTACRLLAESAAPVSRIAGLLDYSTTAPFTQAFKRWTGMSPLAYRMKMRGGNDGKAVERLVDARDA